MKETKTQKLGQNHQRSEVDLEAELKHGRQLPSVLKKLPL